MLEAIVALIASPFGVQCSPPVGLIDKMTGLARVPEPKRQPELTIELKIFCRARPSLTQFNPPVALNLIARGLASVPDPLKQPVGVTLVK